MRGAVRGDRRGPELLGECVEGWVGDAHSSGSVAASSNRPNGMSSVRYEDHDAALASPDRLGELADALRRLGTPHKLEECFAGCRRRPDTGPEQRLPSACTTCPRSAPARSTATPSYPRAVGTACATNLLSLVRPSPAWRPPDHAQIRELSWPTAVRASSRAPSSAPSAAPVASGPRSARSAANPR